MKPEQLEQLIIAHHRALELFAAQWSDTPEDCVQDAFLQLHRSPKTIQNPRAWLYRVVRNLAIDSGRSEASRKRRERQVAAKPDWFEKRDSVLEAGQLQEALSGLDSELREVVVARIWGKLTLAEIAEALGIATSTAHRRYEQGIQALQKKFKFQTKEQS